MKIDSKIDITQEHCPITLVKVKLALSKLVKGQCLEVLLSDGEPLSNVPRAVVEHGHKILENREIEKGKHLLIIEK